jgi:hypothetical protein
MAPQCEGCKRDVSPDERDPIPIVETKTLANDGSI